MTFTLIYYFLSPFSFSNSHFLSYTFLSILPPSILTNTGSWTGNKAESLLHDRMRNHLFLIILSLGFLVILFYKTELYVCMSHFFVSSKMRRQYFVLNNVSSIYASNLVRPINCVLFCSITEIPNFCLTDTPSPSYLAGGTALPPCRFDRKKVNINIIGNLTKRTISPRPKSYFRVFSTSNH